MNKFNSFLKRLYEYLLKLGLITKVASNSKDKINIINAYLDELTDRDILPFLEKFIKNDIPNSYFLKLTKKFIDNGYDNFDFINVLDFTTFRIKNETIYDITCSKEQTIKTWLDYLTSLKSQDLPRWAKVWAFLGMLKIGTLDKEKNVFNKRDNNTVYPYIELDEKLLRLSITYLENYFNNVSVPDYLKDAVSSESFFKIYTTLLLEKYQAKKEDNEGIWVSYKSGDNLKLFNDLKGYGTGWCIAGSLQSATNYLTSENESLKEMHIYYTKNDKGEYKIPRLAIAVDYKQIKEAKGILFGQQVEPSLNEILTNKLSEFSNCQDYLRKVKNIERMTDIYYNQNNLSTSDLIFLYEVNELLLNYDNIPDRRLKTILSKRDIRKDLATIFNVQINEIGYKTPLNESHIAYIGDICTSMLPLRLVYVRGNLSYQNKDVSELICPDTIIGSLYINLSKAKLIILPKVISSNITIMAEKIENVIFQLSTINGNLSILAPVINKAIFPQVVNGDLDLSIRVIDNLTLPKMVKNDVYMNELTKINSSNLPEYIGGDLYLISLDIKDLLFVTLPKNVSKIHLTNNQVYSLEELQSLIELYKAKLDSLIMQDFSTEKKEPNRLAP